MKNVKLSLYFGSIHGIKVLNRVEGKIIFIFFQCVISFPGVYPFVFFCLTFK